MPRVTARTAGRRLAAELRWDAAEPVLARQLSGGTRQKLNLTLAPHAGSWRVTGGLTAVRLRHRRHVRTTTPAVRSSRRLA